MKGGKVFLVRVKNTKQQKKKIKNLLTNAEIYDRVVKHTFGEISKRS